VHRVAGVAMEIVAFGTASHAEGFATTYVPRRVLGTGWSRGSRDGPRSSSSQWAKSGWYL
jgi:hypothetical protein